MPVLTDPLGWFTLEVPEGWEMRTEDCVTTLTGPLRPGTVYISGARHARGRQEGFGGADFLARFLTAWRDRVRGGDRLRGPSRVPDLHPPRRYDSRHWRFWSVTDDETALLISTHAR